MTLDTQTLALLPDALSRLAQGFAHLPDAPPTPDLPALARVLDTVATRLHDNFPYHHPLYAGQMLKPPHPVARLAYMLALWVNPNNHALDGGRASSGMEREAVAAIAQMFGWTSHLGHLTSGGTLANLEALWVAGQLHPGRKIVASSQSHYTHQRITGVLGLPFESVACDRHARMDLDALEALLQQGEVGTVVVTMGTTAAGAVDPLPEILRLRERYPFRIHADTAYGGYFRLAGTLDARTQAAYAALAEVDSIVIDPHKHGLQPYGCGCVLFQDPAVGQLYQHDSPYTYFSSTEMHLGEISLECSRAGASAVALWATQQLLPMVRDGELAQGLDAGHQAAVQLHQRLAADTRFMTAFPPELDIVVWAPTGHGARAMSERSQAIFDAAAAQDLHLALASFPKSLLAPYWDIEWDQDHVTCLRSCLMKPEHLAWLDEIWQRLDTAARQTSQMSQTASTLTT